MCGVFFKIINIDFHWVLFFVISLIGNSFILFLVFLVDIKDLHHIVIVGKLFIRTFGCDPTIFHNHNLVCQMNKVNCVRNKNSCFVFKQILEDLLEDSLAYVSVQS